MYLAYFCQKCEKDEFFEKNCSEQKAAPEYVLIRSQSFFGREPDQGGITQKKVGGFRHKNSKFLAQKVQNVLKNEHFKEKLAIFRDLWKNWPNFDQLSYFGFI